MYKAKVWKLYICIKFILCVTSNNLSSKHVYGFADKKTQSHIASFKKSETEEWHYSISNARCQLDVKKRRFKICPIGVVHFEYFTEPMRLESFSWCQASVSETRISAIYSRCLAHVSDNSYIGYNQNAATSGFWRRADPAARRSAFV